MVSINLSADGQGIIQELHHGDPVFIISSECPSVADKVDVFECSIVPFISVA